MQIAKQPFVQEMISLCTQAYQKGWHERNGGNVSYRLLPEEVAACRPFFGECGPWQPLTYLTVPHLAGEFFLITASGSYFKKIANAPRAYLCIVEIAENAAEWRVVWGLQNGGRPTSELLTHLYNHDVKAAQGERRVLYHAHPPHIIALSFLLEQTDRAYSNALWQSISECGIFFPKGVAVVPWMLPGSPALAKATAQKFATFDVVVWPHHGVLCTGTDFDDALGLLEMIEKAAQIQLLVYSTGKPVVATITAENMREMAQHYHLPLREDFL